MIAVDGGLIFSSEILANGKLLLFGYINGSSDSDFLMIRYTTNGSIDNTFGTNGFLTTDFGTNEGAFSSLTQPDGKIIVGGGTYNTVSGAVDFTLLRYTIDALSTIDFKKEPLLAYPNPFTNSITINFDLDNNDVFDIDLYDINGRKVKNLLSTTSFNAGNTTRTLAVPENLVHGNYLLKITSSNESKVLKMVK